MNKLFSGMPWYDKQFNDKIEKYVGNDLQAKIKFEDFVRQQHANGLETARIVEKNRIADQNHIDRNAADFARNLAEKKY